MKKLFFILLLFTCFQSYSQERQVLFGVSLGTGVVPSSAQNFLSLNKEIGITVLYQTNSPFELQLNSSYCRRNTRIIVARYKNYTGAKAAFIYKPKYAIIENALLINYKLPKHDKALRLIFGIGLNYNNLVGYRWKSKTTNFRNGYISTYNEYIDEGHGGQNLSGSIIIGISSLKKFKRNGKPYMWTFLYQKATNRAPTFHIAGNVYFNSYDKHSYNITSSPYIDALCLKLTYFPFSTRAK